MTLLSTQDLKAEILEGLNDIKAEEISYFDLKTYKNSVCKGFFVCNGSSTTHVSAIAECVRKHVSKKLKQNPFSYEGKMISRWILLDYVDIVVHVFLSETRSYYDIEGMWRDYLVDGTKK